MIIKIYSTFLSANLFKSIIVIFIISMMVGCATWDLGRVGYIEPSSEMIHKSTKSNISEECAVIMGEPFIEKALKNANTDRLTNVVITIDQEGTKACYRIYADKIEAKKEIRK